MTLLGTLQPGGTKEEGVADVLPVLFAFFPGNSDILNGDARGDVMSKESHASLFLTVY